MPENMMIVNVGLRILETLTSALYENPIVIFREYVQNSVDSFNDSKAKKINKESDFFNVKIETVKTEQSTKIIIADNGYGIPHDDFLNVMNLIGDSNKDTESSIGFRGIGRLSALPFCKKMSFKNKPAGHDYVQIFSFDGDKYKDLLNSHERDLSAGFNEMVSFSKVKHDNIEEHFFVVEIEGVRDDISYYMENVDLLKRELCVLLPIDYDVTFKYRGVIKQRYEEIFGNSFDDFAYDVYLNGELLKKPYNNSHINESDIVFKEFRVKNEVVGIMWFSFNRIFDLRKIQEPKGIMVRSKNVLMGSTLAIVKDAFRSQYNPFTTERELTQTIQGLSGELLILTPKLKDNARRDWFKIDEYSLMFSEALRMFFQEVHDYRYSASKYQNALKDEKSTSQKKEELKAVLIEKSKALFSVNDTGIINVERIEAAYIEQKRSDDLNMEENDDNFNHDYANDNIPFESDGVKHVYNFFMNELKKYFLSPQLGNYKRSGFLKLESYLVKKYQESHKDK